MSELPFEIDPRQAADMLARGEIELIDVREPYERAAGHVPGSRHVQLGELSAAAGELPANRPLVFICRVGARSYMAAQAFARSGYDAHNLGGGMLAWAAEGLPMEGHVATH